MVSLGQMLFHSRHEGYYGGSNPTEMAVPWSGRIEMRKKKKAEDTSKRQVETDLAKLIKKAFIAGTKTAPDGVNQELYEKAKAAYDNRFWYSQNRSWTQFLQYSAPSRYIRAGVLGTAGMIGVAGGIAAQGLVVSLIVASFIPPIAVIGIIPGLGIIWGGDKIRRIGISTLGMANRAFDPAADLARKTMNQGNYKENGSAIPTSNSIENVIPPATSKKKSESLPVTPEVPAAPAAPATSSAKNTLAASDSTAPSSSKSPIKKPDHSPLNLKDEQLAALLNNKTDKEAAELEASLKNSNAIEGKKEGEKTTYNDITEITKDGKLQFTADQNSKKQYFIKIPRMENGNPSNEHFDLLYFKNGQLVSAALSEVGESQLDMKYLEQQLNIAKTAVAAEAPGIGATEAVGAGAPAAAPSPADGDVGDGKATTTTILNLKIHEIKNMEEYKKFCKETDQKLKEEYSGIIITFSEDYRNELREKLIKELDSNKVEPYYSAYVSIFDHSSKIFKVKIENLEQYKADVRSIKEELEYISRAMDPLFENNNSRATELKDVVRVPLEEIGAINKTEQINGQQPAVAREPTPRSASSVESAQTTQNYTDLDRRKQNKVNTANEKDWEKMTVKEKAAYLGAKFVVSKDQKGIQPTQKGIQPTKTGARSK